jgi:hypothetical protein
MEIFAYLDPGSGSMLLQMLLGGIAGVAVSIKMFGKRIFSTLAFWKKDEEQPASTPPSRQPDSDKKPAEESV